jgi:uncharacterized phage protein (TIGR02220 family)
MLVNKLRRVANPRPRVYASRVDAELGGRASIRAGRGAATLRAGAFSPPLRGCIIGYDAYKWAIAQQLQSSSSKFVLLALADAARADARAFPSCETIEQFTRLDARTVTRALADLVARGFIRDTGERVGRTGRVKVYELCTSVRSSVPSICSDAKMGVLGNKNAGIKHPQKRGDSIPTKMGGLERVHASPTASLQLPGVAAVVHIVKRGPSEVQQAQAREVLDYLNLVSKSRFQPTAKNLGFVLARLADGYTAHMLKLVAYHRLITWRKDNPAMLEYLRPATLYNSEKCDQYAGQVPAFYSQPCTCGAEVLPDRGPCCKPEIEPEATAEISARVPMPEHMRRREGESVKAWIERVKPAAAA